MARLKARGEGDEKAGKGQPTASQPQTELEKKVVGILKTRKSEQASKKGGIKTLDAVLLKFAAVEETLQNLRRSFKQYDADSSGSIEYGELNAAMTSIGCECEATLLRQIFSEADIYADNKLAFKEFIIALGLACILGVISEDVMSGNAELMKTFIVVVDAWLLFDKDASGSIDRSEMMSTLAERGGSGVFDAARWSEADVNSDGSLSFKEVRTRNHLHTPLTCSFLQFMWMFLSWVGIEDEGEEGEEAEDEKSEQAATAPAAASSAASDGCVVM